MIEDAEIKAAQKSARMVQFYCRKYAGLCHFFALLLQFFVGFLCPARLVCSYPNSEGTGFQKNFGNFSIMSGLADR